jgi:hypothetical protein
MCLDSRNAISHYSHLGVTKQGAWPLFCVVHLKLFALSRPLGREEEEKIDLEAAIARSASSSFLLTRKEGSIYI